MNRSPLPVLVSCVSRVARYAVCGVAGLLLLSGWAWGQSDKVWRIGVTKIVSHAALDADEKGFEAGLAAAGFKEGVNVEFDRQNALGDVARADAIARRFVANRVDLIHAIATPAAQAVVRTGSRIPLVFSSVTDPVFAGIVFPSTAPNPTSESYVTGVTDLWPVALQMQTYAKTVPKAKSWGTIYNPAEPNSVKHIQAMRQVAKDMGLELREVHVSRSDEVASAARSLVGKVQAITITSDNTTVARLEDIVQVCERHKIPLFAGDVDSVSRGAVMAYGMDYFLIGYAAGKKAALVLKGVPPGAIPWGPVERFSLVVNVRAAQAQGVTLPSDLLVKADKVLR